MEHPDFELLARFARNACSREERAGVIRHLLKGCPRCGQEVSGFLKSADDRVDLRPVVDRAVETFLEALAVEAPAPRAADRQRAWRSYTPEAAPIL